MLLLACLFVGIGLVTAQTQTVTGVVISEEDGQPVIGASVRVENTQLGAITDVDGKFQIANVPSSAKTLVVSYIGLQTQTVMIKPNLQVMMKADSELLDEVVVVGYGSAKKVGTVVGSISTVSSDKIAERPVTNVLDALQGQVAGLQIYTNTGDPGDTNNGSSYLRGVGSLTAGNSPLYVLDGSPVSSEIMAMMNPNDFASVTVLKDASATSIYGSRAANGVIYITTKRGKASEKAVVTVSGSYGVSSLARKVGNPMNSSQFLDYWLERGVLSQDSYDKYKASGIDTNWQDYFFENSPMYQGNISVQGGGEKSMYYLSSSYLNQEGIVYGSGYERYTLRANLESQATDWLRIGANIAGAYDMRETSPYTYQGSNNLNGGIFGTLLNQPIFNPYDENGNRLEFIDGLGAYDPNYLTDKSPSGSNQAQFNGNAFIQLTPVKGLTLRSQLGIEAYDYRQTTKRLPSHPNAAGVGYTREWFQRNAQFTITNTAEYKFDINQDHHVTLLAGQEGIKTDLNSFGSQTNGQNDDRLTMIQNGTSAILLDGSYNTAYSYAYLSFFGRADYSYKDKYFADFSVRNDASSRFGADNRSATFFSGGLMWNLKKEAFLEDADFLTGLKLKGSVGSTGNSDIGNYDHLALVGTNNYDGSNGWYISAPGNEELGWETQILTNVGVEASFFDRIRAELTWYNRTTKDMLMEVPVPYTSGFSTIMQNVGSMKNTGVELTLGFDIIKTRDMLLQFNMNYSYNKNEITELFYGYEEWPMPSYTLTYKVGEPVQFYLPIWAGVDPADGQQMWYIPGTDGETTKDANLAGSGALDQASGKTRYAPHNGGFNLNFNWKGLSIGADFSWVLGKYLLNNDRYFSENPAAFPGYNQSADILDEWKEPGDITDTPVFGSVMLFDSHLLENASFLRLKNLAIGYQLPKAWLEKTKVIKNFKITASSRNLFTITKYKGADPEIDTNLTYGAYPNTRQFTIGAEITF